MSDRGESWTRRACVSGLTMVGTGGLLGMYPEPVGAEPPPEITTARVAHTPAAERGGRRAEGKGGLYEA